MRGLSQDAILKIATTYFTEQAVIERLKGNADDIDIYDVVQVCKARLEDRGNTTFAKDSSAVKYDATVLLIGFGFTTEPNTTYRVTVNQFKAPEELEGDDSTDEPVLKRIRVLRIVLAEALDDVSGQDLFSILRCTNGPPE